MQAVREREVEEDRRSSFDISGAIPKLCLVAPVPIFGGGDVFSSQDYWEKLEQSNVDGIMIGRGALIKPWIFTEVQEHREWDISSRERLELLRKVRLYRFISRYDRVNARPQYAEYGLKCVRLLVYGRSLLKSLQPLRYRYRRPQHDTPLPLRGNVIPVPLCAHRPP